MQEVIETLTFKGENATCIYQVLRKAIVIPFGHHQFRTAHVTSRVNYEFQKINVSYKVLKFQREKYFTKSHIQGFCKVGPTSTIKYCKHKVKQKGLPQHCFMHGFSFSLNIPFHLIISGTPTLTILSTFSELFASHYLAIMQPIKNYTMKAKFITLILCLLLWYKIHHMYYYLIIPYIKQQPSLYLHTCQHLYNSLECF